ncbi:MAG: tripartite tricarboxylate transporter TctB family protein [Rhodospirillales bacterium]|nr:tripartite tricarboxylate transporter TctB family protein [Rhodospirillales bacterium]
MNFNTIAAIGFIAFSLLLFLLIPSQIERPLLIMGQSPGLDPALFPTLVASGFGGLGIWYLVKSRKLRETNGLKALDREAILNVSISIAVFVAYALLMEPLGFIPSSALMIFGLSLFYGIRNIYLVGVICLAVPSVTYFIFTKGLKVFLPEFPFL